MLHANDHARAVRARVYASRCILTTTPESVHPVSIKHSLALSSCCRSPDTVYVKQSVLSASLVLFSERSRLSQCVRKTVRHSLEAVAGLLSLPTCTESSEQPCSKQVADSATTDVVTHL